MIDKILWATDGSKDSIEALNYAELLARKFKAEIIGLAVILDYYGISANLPADEKIKFTKWVEETELKERKALENIAKNLKEKGISFTIEVEKGIPHIEILRVAEKEKVDLIALGKGRAIEKVLLGGTAIKVLRRSSFPVLTASEGRKGLDIKRILVPTDMSHGLSKDFKYAVKLSKEFGAIIHLLNIIEVGEFDFPLEIAQQLKGFSFKEIVENIGKVKIEERVETHIEVAKNAWRGIVKFAEEKDIDLIVMMTYGGRKHKGDFIGSVAEKVIQESAGPVITLTP